jgi:hypothetical protein
MASLTVGQSLPFMFSTVDPQSGKPEHPVALLSFGRIHVRAIERCLGMQDYPVDKLFRKLDELRSEVLTGKGQLRSDGILRFSVLPMFPPTAFEFARVLFFRPRQQYFPLLLPKLSYEASNPKDRRPKLPPVEQNEVKKLVVNLKTAWAGDKTTWMNDDMSTCEVRRSWAFFVLVLYTIRNYQVMHDHIIADFIQNTNALSYQLFKQENGVAHGLVTRWWDLHSTSVSSANTRQNDMPVVLSCLASIW